ncbi:MAG: tyrosine-protein phosphatase [Actinomycetes bacterium]
MAFGGADDQRIIVFEGPVNFRDVGGYRAIDGRTVKWGRFYRADSLVNLSAEDYAAIKDLGIATVLDLRTTTELEDGGFDVSAVDVDFHHLPLMESVPHPDEFKKMPGLLAETYLEMLDAASTELAEALRVISRRGAQPLVIHCTAGKDRTGVLTALVLGLLGIPRDQIVLDYSLSGLGMDRLRLRLVDRYPDAEDAIMGAHEVFSADPSNIERLLDEIDTRWGSIEALAAHLGIESDVIETLRNHLLEG